MDNTVMIDAGEVVGIGKMKLFSTENIPDIPTLSFIVTKCDDGSYVASCLHLLLDSHAHTDREAVDRLENNCMEYVQMFFDRNRLDEKEAWKELSEIFASNVADSYWSAYRKMQILLAANGIKTSSQQVLEKKIEELQEQLEEFMDKKLKIKVVDYKKVA